MSALMAGAIVAGPRLVDNLPLFGVALASAMYWRGGRRQRSAGWRAAVGSRRVASERSRTAVFAAAMATLVVALQEPLDGLADSYLWAHMVQHVLLLVVAAPLLVLARPWMRLWRGVPLAVRRPLAATLVHGRWSSPLRVIAAVWALPVVAWVVMNVDILAWHLPAAYDLTLRSNAVHYTEHATFLVFSVIGWAQVIDSPPFHTRLDLPRRGAFVLGSMVVGWLLAVPMAFSNGVWYGHYAHVRHGGLSAIADQHLAAGVMWVMASLPWSLAVFLLLYRWVSDREWGAPAHVRAPVPVDAPTGPVTDVSMAPTMEAADSPLTGAATPAAIDAARAPIAPAGGRVAMVQTARRRAHA